MPPPCRVLIVQQSEVCSRARVCHHQQGAAQRVLVEGRCTQRTSQLPVAPQHHSVLLRATAMFEAKGGKVQSMQAGCRS
jgi:hypothetical protein